MSKELTEKWKNRELVAGWYFLEFENGSILPVYYCGFNREFEFRWDWKISKVLAPLPSYDQFPQLVKKVDELKEKLDIATNALREYARGDSDVGNGCLYEMPAPSLAQKALKEIDLVGKSVKEEV